MKIVLDNTLPMCDNKIMMMKLKTSGENLMNLENIDLTPGKDIPNLIYVEETNYIYFII